MPVPAAFIFDLDGVIVDSNPVHVLAWSRYLETQGRRLPEAPEPLIFGRRNDEIVRDLFGDHLSEAEIAAHGAAKEALYRELMRPVLVQRLVPGVAAWLRRWKVVPLGLASNAERANIDFVLEGAGLRDVFRVVLDGSQALRPKPFPDIYLEMARRLGAPPEACIVFEDSHAGVEAARAAGTRVIGVCTTHQELPGVERNIRNFLDPELEAWLRAQFSAA